MRLKLDGKCGKTHRVSVEILESLRLDVVFLRALFICFFPLVASASVANSAQKSQVTAYIFWQSGYLYCTKVKSALKEIGQAAEDVRVEEIELGVSIENNTLFLRLIELFEVQSPAVPFVVVGERQVIGLADGGRTTSVYQSMIAQCQESPCKDLVSEMRQLQGIAGEQAALQAAPKPSAEPLFLAAAIELKGEAKHIQVKMRY